ncbi:hypothetical protein QUA08_28525, partial [Microcoleus sp. T3B2]|uniref:hypothetical protein n=1 Tax=Microcoleus sp. T3B2 TaxID=3055426 RepID=UPI002FCFB1D6
KKIHSLWNRPKSLFIKDLLTIMQHRKMPVPQENSLFVEQAEKPVHKRLINNNATSQDACSTRKFTLCGTGRKACS